MNKSNFICFSKSSLLFPLKKKRMNQNSLYVSPYLFLLPIGLGASLVSCYCLYRCLPFLRFKLARPAESTQDQVELGKMTSDSAIIIIHPGNSLPILSTSQSSATLQSLGSSQSHKSARRKGGARDLQKELTGLDSKAAVTSLGQRPNPQSDGIIEVIASDPCPLYFDADRQLMYQ